MKYVRLLSKLFAVCIVAALCGCRSGNAGGNVEAHAASSPAATAAILPAAYGESRNAADAASPDSRPVIACFGDSITAGLGLDPASTYPADLQRNLDASGFRYHVANLGVSGETTKDALARIDRVIASHPAIVVVEFGGNDGLRGLPIADTQRNLAQIVARLKSSGSRVLLAGISLPPDYGQDYVSRFKAMYPAVAREQGVSLLPYIYKGVYGVPGYIQSDGIHPTAQGGLQIARNVEEALKPLLRR